MGPSMHCSTRLAPIVALIVSACASAPQEPAQSNSVALSQEPSAQTAENATAPDLVVDALDPAPESAVVCRDVLKQGSNVIVTRCMTIAGWERFDRQQEHDAQAFVRMLQGSAYRF